MTTTEFFTSLHAKIDAFQTACLEAADGEEDTSEADWTSTLIDFLAHPEIYET